MTPKEYDQTCLALEKDFAVQSIEVIREKEKEYGAFIFIGTEKARKEMQKQWEEAKNRAINQELHYLKHQLEGYYFGLGGQQEALKQIEAGQVNSMNDDENVLPHQTHLIVKIVSTLKKLFQNHPEE